MANELQQVLHASHLQQSPQLKASMQELLDIQENLTLYIFRTELSDFTRPMYQEPSGEDSHLGDGPSSSKPHWNLSELLQLKTA